VPTVYPCVPGHEIVGRVTKVGPRRDQVQARATFAAVGCHGRFRRHLAPNADARAFEQFSARNHDPHVQTPSEQAPRRRHLWWLLRLASSWTSGSFLRVPSNLESRGAAPLLCAGITTTRRMRRWGVTKGRKSELSGLGGLGHMGVKYCSCDSDPTLLSSRLHPTRRKMRSGSAPTKSFVSATHEMQKARWPLRFLLDAVSADHDINAYIQLHPAATPTSPSSGRGPRSLCQSLGMGLLFGRRSLSRLAIRWYPRNPEMLDSART